MGLIGMEDPVRPGVPQAIKECYSAGIRVVMIAYVRPAHIDTRIFQSSDRTAGK
jgi:hypothetical protein